MSVIPHSSRGLSPDVAASLVLHAILLAAIIWLLPLPKVRNAPAEKAVSVEVVPPPPAKPFEVPSPLYEPDILRTPPTIPLPEKAPAAAASGGGQGLTQATKLFAKNALAKPANARAVASLGTLEASERAEQLCDIEGMEQVAASDKRFAPELMVAYAMKNTRMKGDVLEADGAAFRSKGKWYNFEFHCEIKGNPEEVTSYAFKIGDSIPRDQWSDHGLTAAEDEDHDD